MRKLIVAVASAAGLIGFATGLEAAPLTVPASASISNVEQVAGGCGWGFHRYRGYCVRNHHYRVYSYRRYYYPPYAYYGGGYQPWNRPSPSDHVADWLNAQEAHRGGWGY